LFVSFVSFFEPEVRSSLTFFLSSPFLAQKQPLSRAAHRPAPSLSHPPILQGTAFNLRVRVGRERGERKAAKRRRAPHARHAGWREGRRAPHATTVPQSRAGNASGWGREQAQLGPHTPPLDSRDCFSRR